MKHQTIYIIVRALVEDALYIVRTAIGNPMFMTDMLNDNLDLMWSVEAGARLHELKVQSARTY